MTRLPNAPPSDIFDLGLEPLKSFLVDLPPKGTRGMRRVKPGFPAMVQEITNNQPTYGERAGIIDAHVTKFTALNAQHDQISVQLPLAEKAYEVLTESLAHVDNLRHRLAATFADNAEAHARAEGGDPTLLTAYEKTIAYRGVTAEKAVKTRKKNSEAKKARASAPAADKPTDDVAAKTTAAADADDADATDDSAKVVQTYSRIPNPPPDDIFKIELAPLQGVLVNLPRGAMVGMRREKEGWQAVYAEITSNQKAFGERAGISSADYDKFVALNKQYAQILAQLPRVEKAVEVLTESLAHVDNLRHRLAATFANAAEAHARMEGDDPTLLTAYEKTIAYRSVSAAKAVKTRRKNEESKRA